MSSIKELLVYKILRVTFYWAFYYFIQPLRNLIDRITDVTVEHFWEKRLGIKTLDTSSVKKDITMFKDSFRYQATPYRIIEMILERLQFQPDDVFVDLGCGKGRVILSVATKNLKKVIGIEARKDMFDIAMDNLKNLKVQNTSVKIVNADIATFDMREGTIFFMFNPFGNKTLAKVMEDIRNSIMVKPRKVRIVCYGMLLEDCDWLIQEEETPCAGVVIYSALSF